MLLRSDLELILQARLADAESLYSLRRYDGANYMCGYAVEIALKLRICRTLNWVSFPKTSNEFKSLQSFRIHDLDVLLRLSGVEDEIKSRHFREWSKVRQWNPELRYEPTGVITDSDAEEMIEASKKLLEIL